MRVSLGSVLHSIATPQPNRSLRLRRWFLAGMAACASAVIAWLLIDLYCDGIDGGVARVLKQTRAAEQAHNSSMRGLGYVLYNLPEPLSSIVEKLLPGRGQDASYYQEQLVGIGSNAIPALLQVVASDKSVWVRQVCAGALGSLDARAAFPVLTNMLLLDESSQVRSSVADSLAALENPEAVPALLAALESEGDAFAMESIVRVFQSIPDPRAVPALASLLDPGQAVKTNDQSWYVFGQYARREVVNSLAAIGGDAALKVLTARLLVETNSSLVENLCSGVGRIGDPRAVPLLLSKLDQDDAVRPTVVEALGNIAHPDALPKLRPLLGNGRKEVRANAAMALAQIGDTNSVPDLLRMLESEPASEVRASACFALALLADGPSSESIVSAISRFGGHSEQAAWALGQLGGTNAIQALAGILQSGVESPRFAAAFSLAEIGGQQAIDVLAANLVDKEENPAFAKNCALTMLGHSNRLDAVRKSLRSRSEWQRFGACMALARSGLATPADFEPLSKDSKPAYRRFATLAAQGRAVAALTEMLERGHRDDRHYAARALAYFNDPAALPALRAASRDSNLEVRNAALMTVRKLERQQRLQVDRPCPSPQ